jgi:hypothetical protein
LCSLVTVGEWLSLVEHLVRDQGVGGSNPLSPTILSPGLSIIYAAFADQIFFGGFRYTRYNWDVESPSSTLFSIACEIEAPWCNGAGHLHFSRISPLKSVKYKSYWPNDPLASRQGVKRQPTPVAEFALRDEAACSLIRDSVARTID